MVYRDYDSIPGRRRTLQPSETAKNHLKHDSEVALLRPSATDYLKRGSLPRTADDLEWGL